MAILKDTVEMVETLGNCDFEFGDITAPIAVGMDLLTAALDPVGALIAAPLGELLDFVVHHVSFIAEPLAKLEGSDDLVQAQVEAWNEVAKKYIAAGNLHAAGVSDMPGWTGPASVQYHEIMKATNGIFAAVADGAKKMGMAVEAAGILVGTLRGFIWDMISQLLASAISSGIAALAAAVPTFGASLAAFAGWYTAKVGALATKIFGFISKLMGKAAKFTKKCSVISKAFKKAQQYCDDVVKQLENVQRYAGRTVAPKVTRSTREQHTPVGTLPGNTTAPHGPGRAKPPSAKGPLDSPSPRPIGEAGDVAKETAKDAAKDAAKDLFKLGAREAREGVFGSDDEELTRL